MIRGGRSSFAVVYRRQKHPFLSPPATLNPREKFSTFVQDTLRSPVLGSIPFFDQGKVIDLLDGLDGMDQASRVASDQVLMIPFSGTAKMEVRRHVSYVDWS